MRFVFVLSICFFILNFSLYSIFNEHELTLEFIWEFTRESSPDLGFAELIKNVSQAQRLRLTSEDAILSHGFSSYAFSLFFRPEPKGSCRKNGGDDGNRTHDPLLAGQVLSQLSYTPILGRLVLKNWTTNRVSSALRSRSSKVFVLVYFQTTRTTLMILTFSIERRWSSRTFRYGYLVTT